MARRHRSHLRAALALIGTLTLIAVACGSSSDDASGATMTLGSGSVPSTTEPSPSTTAPSGSEVPHVATATAAAEGADWGDNVTVTVENGAVLFNPYEGDNTTVAYDDNFVIAGVPFIDDCGGHPAPPQGQYHYHGIPTCITSEVDTAGEHSAMIGYLLDGLPVYGPQGEGGDRPTDLDECSGHFGPTPEFPQGVYHYHLTETSPYSITCYHGTVDAAATQSGPPAGGPPAVVAKTVALSTAYCHLPTAQPTAA